MTIPRTSSGSPLPRRLGGYICPQCFTTYREASTSFFKRARTTYKTRCFTSSVRTSLPETTLSARSSPDPLPFATSQPKLGNTSTRKASIRDHLRAWTIENQKRKAEEAEGSLSSTGRVTILPNSLFIEEARVEDDAAEDLEDELDNDSAVTSEAVKDLIPGDLIFCRSGSLNTREQLAVFLGYEGAQAQFFLQDGRWLVDRFITHNSPVLNGFATAEEVQAIRQYMPKREIIFDNPDLPVNPLRSFVGEIPNSASADVLSRLVQLNEDILAFRRQNIEVLDSIYDSIAHDEYYTTIKFDQVVEKLMGCKVSDLEPPALMSIFFALRKKPTLVQIIRSPKTGQLHFIILSKNSARRFSNVTRWARDYQEAAAQSSRGKNVKSALNGNPLTAFIDKARRIILQSRKLRSPTTTGHLGPSSIQSAENGKIVTQETGEKFSDNDRMVLEFLWDCYMREPKTNMSRTVHHSVASLILRAIGAYPKLRLEQKIGRLLMQELGVLPPWSDGLDHNLLVALAGRRGGHEVDALIDKAEKSCDDLGWEEDSSYSAEHDTMASLRHVFHLPALCVDHISTKIRDDAYSLEPHESMPGTFWVHIHVAHPSAFIKPDHPIAQLAAKNLTSIYTVTEVFHMVPRKFSTTLSLKSGNAALTISTLLREDGEVLDIKLQPTILENVVILESQAVQGLVQVIDEEKRAQLFVGPTDNGLLEATHETLSEASMATAREHSATFVQLQKLMKARGEARKRETAVPADWPIRTYSSYTTAYNAVTTDLDQNFPSRHFLGDPSISCIGDQKMKTLTMAEQEMAHDLTNGLMILAGESAAKWFMDRGIAAPFSGTVVHPEYPVARLNKLDFGERRRLPEVRFTSKGIPHVYNNLKQYLRITSPLRRYFDLIALWQADAYLKAEAAASSPSSDGLPSSNVPFSEAQVEEQITSNIDKIDTVRRYLDKSMQYWRLRALFRAFHFKEAELPETWDMLVRNVSLLEYESPEDEDSSVRGQIIPFGFDCVLLSSRKRWETNATISSYLPVKIELVDLSAGKVICRAVGPARKDPQFATDLQIVSRR